MAGPEAEGTKAYRHIGRVQVPLLLVHALHDDVIEHHEGENLGKVAIATGHNDTTQVFLETGHTFEDKMDELVKTTVDWLKARFLPN